MNRCVLGGTFDPIHRGHMVVASVVREKLCPAEIILIPAGQPWLKSGRTIAPTADRLAMARLAAAGQAGISVSTIETDRPGPSYAVDTLLALKKDMPEADELFFILGWDNLLDLPRWHKPREILSLCRLAAVPRIGSRVPDAATMEKLLPGLSRRVILLDKPEIDISATVIRERVKLGLTIRHLVPDAVEEYILGRGLYREKS
jgi:nicotinate-nucleotide adenylyltransferase